MEEITVARTDAADTFELRQQVLRPHQTRAEMALPGDDDPDTGNFCALDTSGRVVGTASVRRENPSWAPTGVRGWRLRGMATSPSRRSLGIGTAVLDAVIDHVAILGGGLLWCHARLPAVEFYRRAGFATRGEPWEDPAIGAHVVMWREVVALEPGTGS